jgi:molybdenum cofactor cytidylyltransferase
MPRGVAGRARDTGALMDTPAAPSATFRIVPAEAPLAGLATVLMLASGRGARFLASGGRVHKLDAQLAGRPVRERTLDAVRASGLPWHLEDAGHPGMGDSIAAAVRATAGAVGWLILPADLPLVLPRTLVAVARAMAARQPGDGFASTSTSTSTARAVRTAYAVQPAHEGRRGHPVGFAPGCREELLRLRGEFGAQPILRRLREAGLVEDLAVDDAGIVTDIDTLADLAAAEALLLSRAGPRVA